MLGEMFVLWRGDATMARERRAVNNPGNIPEQGGGGPEGRWHPAKGAATRGDPGARRGRNAAAFGQVIRSPRS